MSTKASYDKDAILRLYDEGKKPAEIEAETGTPRLVIGQVIKRERNPNPAPKDERTKKTVAVVEGAKEKPNAADKPAAKPAKKLTAKGAAALWKLLFGVVAMRLGGGWRLSDEEARQLGEATMECLGDLPDPIVGAIGTFAGPGVLAATLLTIVQTRLERASQLNGPVVEQEGTQPPPPPGRRVPPPPPSNVIDLRGAQRVQPEGEPADNTEQAGMGGFKLTAQTQLRAPSRRNGGDTGAVFGIPN